MLTSAVRAERGRELVALAERALAALAPLRLGTAGSEAEYDAVLRMRFDCVVVEGWASPADFPDGRERDSDDDRAIFITCHDGEELVGSMRMILPVPGEPLPVERAFGLRPRDPGAIAEVGRLVVTPDERRGRGHRIVGGLCARGWLEAFAHGCDRTISAATPQLIELYRALGLHVAVLGPARPYWGAARAPISIEGDEHSFAFLTGVG